ncbi:MAG: hypothetical protein HZC42_02555 [Candidatus Eisenbacteria bacterium]|nr:hypothetical protein [Candidatus Eisenbacteria bacterium]
MRDRRAAIALAAAALALHLVLAAGALVVLPATLRTLLAFAVLVLAPGLALVRLTMLPPGGAWLVMGWALGLGVAWNGLLVLAARALGQPFTPLAAWAVAPNALLWALALARRAGPAAPVPPLPRWAGMLVLLAAALAAWHAGLLGPPLTYTSDSPDHLGTIRRMMASGDAFPTDAFFRDAGPAGADPRKGLWHPQVALVAKLAAVDPIVAWRLLAGALAALFVLNAAALGALIGGVRTAARAVSDEGRASAGDGCVSAALAGWALLFTYGGSLAQPPLREAVFATKLADQLALATTVAVLADLATPSRARRLAAVGLGLGAMAAHLFSAVQFALVFGGLGAGLLLRDRRWSPAVARLTGTVLAVGAACLPYLLYRAHQSYAPRNPIHTESQGLLWLWDGARIVSIGVLWDWMGRLWLLFPLAWLALWRRGRGNPAVLYLLTTSLGVALVVFDPPVVALLEPRVGYLLMRFVWMVPLAGLLAWMIPALARDAWATAREVPTGGERGSRALGARAWPLAGLAGVALLLLPALRDGVTTLLHPERAAAADLAQSPLRWRDALSWMNAHLPAGSVVLADPATSYGVPMLTRHYVVCLVDQHSSPNDPQALRRLLDARDALDPYASWERTRAVVRRYGVDAVALNGRFTEAPRLAYWTPRPDWYRAARARLDAVPAAFERVYDRDRFAVYRVRRAALDTLSASPRPRAFVRTFAPGSCPVARRMGPGLPALVSLALAARTARPGESLGAVAEWRAPGALPAGSCLVAVRFDRALPGGVSPPRFLSKPVRKVMERLNRERYRFRVDHLPAGGEYGVELWRPDEVVRDSFEVAVPRDVAAGDYQVRVRIIRQPIFPNYRLADYFFDDDYYSGVPAGTLHVVRAEHTP